MRRRYFLATLPLAKENNTRDYIRFCRRHVITMPAMIFSLMMLMLRSALQRKIAFDTPAKRA